LIKLQSERDKSKEEINSLKSKISQLQVELERYASLEYLKDVLSRTENNKENGGSKLNTDKIKQMIHELIIELQNEYENIKKIELDKNTNTNKDQQPIPGFKQVISHNDQVQIMKPKTEDIKIKNKIFSEYDEKLIDQTSKLTEIKTQLAQISKDNSLLKKRLNDQSDK